MRICTTNPGKLREFGGLLSPLGIELRVSDPDIDIPETRDSFLGNCQQKAEGYADIYPGEWILAEDSGLVIPALNGLPGPHSARFESLYGGEPSDLANNERVLSLMRGIDKRGGYFVSCIVVVSPRGKLAFVTERRAYGEICREMRGDGGFGYDPIFTSPETFGLTWAEVDSARKSLVSHRNKACWDLLAWVCTQSDIT